MTLDHFENVLGKNKTVSKKVHFYWITKYKFLLEKINKELDFLFMPILNNHFNYIYVFQEIHEPWK